MSNKAKQKENSIQKYIQIAQIIAAIVIGILMVKNFNLEVSRSNSLVYSGVDTMDIVTGHKLDRDQQTKEQQATQDQEQQATQDQEQQAPQTQEQQATQKQKQEHNNKIHTVLLIQKSLVLIGGLAVIVYLNHSKNNQ